MAKTPAPYRPSTVERKIVGLRKSLDRCEIPEDAIRVEAETDTIEGLMRKSGLYSTVEIRPVRELMLDARWTLGKMFRQMERGRGTKGGVRPTFKAEVKRLNVAETRAKEVQRISDMPEEVKAGVYAEAEEQDILPTMERMLEVSRPYWYQEQRKTKHRAIRSKAQQLQELTPPETIGPFPLIYADPPWPFETRSEMGKERSADRHYPPMTDEEISLFEVLGRPVREISTPDAALFLWCTSSNMDRALEVMQEWRFQYKTHAVWVKTGADGKPSFGMGFVFRNAHEVLLYGTRGNMPAPQHQPSSVMMYPRGEHSAKPAEVRTMIEQMYPDFDAGTRLELFARETVEGWSSHGYEAGNGQVRGERPEVSEGQRFSDVDA